MSIIDVTIYQWDRQICKFGRYDDEGFLGVVVPAVAVVGAVDIDEFWLLLLFRLRSTAFDRLWHEDEDEDEDNDDKDEDEDLEDFGELQVSDEFNE